MHVTMRARRDVPHLRSELVFGQVRASIRAAQRTDFRIVHFSVQRDHVHLLVEATDRDCLASGMKGLAVRLARAVNRATCPAPARGRSRPVGRRGRVWAERYHRHDLTSPREVRHALVYILQNHVKHAPALMRAAGTVDPCSSAAWFEGWTPRAGPLLGKLRLPDEGAPVLRPRTWLAREGWRRHRLIEPTERPACL